MSEADEKKVIDETNRRVWAQIEGTKITLSNRIRKELVLIRLTIICVAIVLLFFHLGELAYAKFFR